MYRLMGMALGLAVVVALCADTASAKGGKNKGGDAIPAGYAKVESADAAAKTFKLTADEKTYKYTDATVNKDQIYTGAVIKVTLKDGSADEVTSVDLAPPATHKKKHK